jgi:hypothetical protein
MGWTVGREVRFLIELVIKNTIYLEKKVIHERIYNTEKFCSKQN